ncbi:response regulator [Paenibacillus sp. J22TS3]|uniref:response regulator n=1 Tax=Paenibacillus sp. J22TS3 TaxID=2807192 RepID=UPI001B0A33DD|nr:response regulator [Paenibacillus sp. J22TS3]GIP23749.1 hypothetical protein J22TS3_40240 [Paenibacillus sp. J22TS3]
MDDLDQKNADFKTGLYLLLAFVTAVSILAALLISRTIVRSIEQVTKAIDEIALSENRISQQRIEIRTRDEIRDLGEATNRLLDKHEQENWLQTGIAELATSSQGFSLISELAQAFVAKAALLLHASYGVFYRRTGDTLHKEAAFAGQAGGSPADSFKMGEGLVGQSALEQRSFLLGTVPDHHVRITTGLGESLPSSILIVPVVFEGKVEGVIELASVDTFTSLEQELLEEACRTLGTALNSVAAQMEVKRLLEESQAMSEELQAQTEELQQQTEELQAQSEELVSQQDELEQINQELEARSVELENQMRQTETIKEQVEEQNRKLEQQAVELKTASRYKSEFLANMSHELRTPLNSLLILSQLLADNKEGNLQQKQVDYARTIHTSGSDLLRLIDEILDLSKVEAGQMKVEKETLCLEELKEALQRNFEPVASKKGIGFTIEAEDGVPETVYTDGHRLQQILKNLLSNAIKFTDKGRVSLKITTTPRSGEVTPQEPESYLAFAVTDTGIGIAKDKMDLVFEAFQQADGTTSRKYGGTGLGLTISRELAGLIGGHIEIESEEGHGSTFTLYIPNIESGPFLANWDEPIQSDGVNPVHTPLRNEVLIPDVELTNPSLLVSSEIEDDREQIKPGDKVLLIIEDDIHFAKIMLDIARSRGFKVLVALQGDKGLALVHAFKPDAIMLDIQLPVIDGWSILERLKQNPETRHIPVHVISVVDEQQQGLTMGAMAYLKKPVNKENIENALSRIESFMNREMKRLLIVEDDLVLRDSMVELIGHDDVLITAVSTGEEALRTLQVEHYDCMVMDLGLSDISGFELLDRIRHTEQLHELPIIIYTGQELDMREEMELKKYAESIIVKNVRSQERLFDETALFLHRVEANLPEDRREMLNKLHNSEDAFDGKRILLVEDDIRNVFALSNVLESHNLEVVFAENGREALELLEKDTNFNLILMDIMMPEMDGYETMRAIRAMPQFQHLPIIALTAKAMKEDRQLCLDAGASDYISKPIDTVRLISMLKVWLYG